MPGMCARREVMMSKQFFIYHIFSIYGIATTTGGLVAIGVAVTIMHVVVQQFVQN